MLHKIRKDKRYDEMSRRRHMNPENEREAEMNGTKSNNNDIHNVNMNIASSASSSM